MRTRSKLATLTTTAALAVGSITGLATPAQAQLATGSTPTTFAITGGTIAMTVPAAAALGAVSADATSVSGPLGVVEVIDLRAAASNGWTNTVSSAGFTNGGTTANDKVAPANIAYSSGAGTVTANGTFTAGSKTGLPGAAGVHSADTGISTTTWTPTLTLTLLGSQVAGAYTGSITHSIA